MHLDSGLLAWFSSRQYWTDFILRHVVRSLSGAVKKDQKIHRILSLPSSLPSPSLSLDLCLPLSLYFSVVFSSLYLTKCKDHLMNLPDLL